VGGLVVGLTSVGSGSLIIIMLLMLYPRMKLSELVGTDLVQAVPLVASAALGHMIFGDFKLSLTAAILLGSIPGVFIGARFLVARPRLRHSPLAGRRPAGLGNEADRRAQRRAGVGGAGRRRDRGGLRAARLPARATRAVAGEGPAVRMRR
jgi:hypothetical protein